VAILKDSTWSDSVPKFLLDFIRRLFSHLVPMHQFMAEQDPFNFPVLIQYSEKAKKIRPDRTSLPLHRSARQTLNIATMHITEGWFLRKIALKMPNCYV
jgi:hypothetical protein